MKHAQSTFSDLDQNCTLVRAFRSLRVGDVEIIRMVVDPFGGNWSVQTGDDYDGYLFILIEPSAEHVEQLPTYMVSGKTGQIELSKVCDDNCQPLGRFEDIYAATAELTFRLLCAALEPDVFAG